MADWKKHLRRVKQKAGQTLGQTEKTEVLTDDLYHLEKWVEQVKIQCHNSHKRVKDCLHTSAHTDKDKKLKKLPEYSLSAQLLEASASLTQIKEDTLMGQLMKKCGDAQAALANESLEFEASVETGVLAPLVTLTEQDIPAIKKTRSNLSKLVLDMDMAKNKYHSAVKQQSQGSMPPGKVDAIREELEDAQSKVQSCKDQLSTEMFKFAANEQDYSRFLLTDTFANWSRQFKTCLQKELVEAQAQYHRNALKQLESIIPDMQEKCDCHCQTPVYGTPLEEHLRRVKRDIATVLEKCIITLAELALDEEGLFRIAGGASKVKKLKAAFDAGLVDMEDFVSDIHAVAGALKLYLRELPEPLMTYDLYNEWMAAAHLGHEERMQKLWLLCDRLPEMNLNNLRYLIKFLAKLAENAEVNKMSPSNIAIVMAPNLLWSKEDQGPSVLTTTTQSAIIEALIQHADYFFPGDISFTYSDIRDRSPSPFTQQQRRYTSPALTKNSPTNGTTLSVHNPFKPTISKPSFKLPSPSFKHRPIAIFAPNSEKKTLLQLASPKLRRKTVTTISAPILQKQTTTVRSPSSETEDQQSIDSGIGSSASSSSRKTSLKDKQRISGEVASSPLEGGGDFRSPSSSASGSTRPSIILESSPQRESTSGFISPQRESTSSGFISPRQPINSNLPSPWQPDDVFDEADESGATYPPHETGALYPQQPPPPCEIIESRSPPVKANPPRSVHSDMYDTVFALQALGNNGWSDYLTKVRGLWDGHMETGDASKKRLSFNGMKEEEGELTADEKRMSLRDRTRASSESRLLEVPLEIPKSDLKKEKSLNTVESIEKPHEASKLTKNRSSFGALPIIKDIYSSVTSPTKSSSALISLSNQKPPIKDKPPKKPVRRSTEPTLSTPTLLPDRPKSVLSSPSNRTRSAVELSTPKSLEFSINRGEGREKQQTFSTTQDIQFGLGCSSDKGTPPGTLNAAPPGMYPNLEDMAVVNAPSLSPSASDHALQPDGHHGGVMAGISPRAVRKNKRAAPPPPGGGSDKPLRSNAPAPLGHLEKPATAEKPVSPGLAHRSPGGSSAAAYASQASSERPLGPPPAPPKPMSPGGASIGSVGYDANTGSAAQNHASNQQGPIPSPAARPMKPPHPPHIMHDKPPVFVHSNEQLQPHNTPAYDNVSSLPYGPKPPSAPQLEATSAVTDSASHISTISTHVSNDSTSVSAQNGGVSGQNAGTSGSGILAGKTNSLTRNASANKPPRPPRPVTMASKEGKSTDSEIQAENNTVSDAANSERKKPSVSEETHL